MQKYIRNKELITADLEEDLVMLDIDQGKYFSLNPIGKKIWELLETEASLDEICSKLLLEYDVSMEECTNDVKNHLEELAQLKLIQLI
jgi:hypothetical protein